MVGAGWSTIQVATVVLVNDRQERTFTGEYILRGRLPAVLITG